MKILKVGSDFSGVGAFNQALNRIGIPHEHIFACDWDKYARITYVHNYGKPKYFPKDVHDREIPKESLDIYMTSPPCQSFSLAGKRLGKNDSKGILFFNSHKLIQVNKPRFFIFENVKGLISDNNGTTFQEWVNMLGGKSVNGLPILLPYENSVPYHLYWQVLNSKKHGIPQNRERVFLIGIRDDKDNVFQFPKEEHLTTRLKDVLESKVDKKYFLSHSQIKQLIVNGINENSSDLKCIGNTQSSGNGMNGNVYDSEGISPTLSTNKGEVIKIKQATLKGYEIATKNDSINFSVPNSETRRGRVGKGVAQTLDTQCNQGVIDNYKIRRLTPIECFRLQDFPDTFDFSCVSDSQAYKQAGNSITVRVLEKIIKNFKL
jgi:DNA (cytosine-5)-methyltransferase 1